MVALVVATCLVGACVAGGRGGSGGLGGNVAVLLRQDGRERELCLLLADTQQERSIGLSGRDTLFGTDGMLFAFDDSEQHGFWMRDTRVPLDLLPLDAEGRVTEVIPMTPCADGSPCPIYRAERPFDRAVELSGGTLENWGFDPGAGGLRVTEEGTPCRWGQRGARGEGLSMQAPASTEGGCRRLSFLS